MWLQLFDVAENKGDQLHRGHEPTETNWELSAESEQQLLFANLRARRREGMRHYETKENRSAETWAQNLGLLFAWGHLPTQYVPGKPRCFIQLHAALEVLGDKLRWKVSQEKEA